MSNKLSHSRELRWGLILTSLLATLTLVSVLVISGCSNNPVSTSTAVVEEDVNFFDLPYDETALAKAYWLADALYGEAYLSDEDGGIVWLGKGTSFEVKALSFPADTMFTIEVVKYDSKRTDPFFIFDFGPDGLVFSKSAVLHVNVSNLLGSSVSSLNFYWLNEETNYWEFQGKYVADENGTAHVPIDHFSKFGIKN